MARARSCAPSAVFSERVNRADRRDIAVDEARLACGSAIDQGLEQQVSNIGVTPIAHEDDARAVRREHRLGVVRVMLEADRPRAIGRHHVHVGGRITRLCIVERDEAAVG
jgi:hypothetical protein